ncbi:hypothetical protein, partial [Burkholderia contaminans]
PAPGAGFGASSTRSAFSSVEGGAIGPPFAAAEGGASTVSWACARAVANSDRHVTAAQANRLLALETISPTPGLTFTKCGAARFSGYSFLVERGTWWGE